jgi:hypothetical protein
MQKMSARFLTAIGSASFMSFGACNSGDGPLGSPDGGEIGTGALAQCSGTGTALQSQFCPTLNETCATTFEALDATVSGCCTCLPGCDASTWQCLGGSSEHHCTASPAAEGDLCSDPSQSGTCVYCANTPILTGCRQLADGASAWKRIPVGNGCVEPVDGRPLIVGGAPRLAPLARRRDWCLDRASTERESAAALPAAARAALREAWLRAARYEHASIASFARFTLELLALGAPPDLVARAQRAALDEIDHARRSFAMASRFADEPLGPGPLDVRGAMPAPSLAEAVEAAVREGCIGETIAACVARAALNGATDSEARETLERIAQDEEIHAELAWRFVAWAIRQGGEAVRSAASRAFASRAPESTPEPSVDEASFRRFGRLTAPETARVVNAAWQEVIQPCARALLGACTEDRFVESTNA